MATAWDQLVEKLLTRESSEEMVELRKMLLRRLATETEFVPPRVPAPRNITEIGGYINLLRKDERMLSLLLASILGLPRTSREQ
jgi:hypothethical protein